MLALSHSFLKKRGGRGGNPPLWPVLFLSLLLHSKSTQKFLKPFFFPILPPTCLFLFRVSTGLLDPFLTILRGQFGFTSWKLAASLLHLARSAFHFSRDLAPLSVRLRRKNPASLPPVGGCAVMIFSLNRSKDKNTFLAHQGKFPHVAATDQ